MHNIDNLFDKAITEIDRLINTKTVVGEPIVLEGRTLIPLVNVGFGFGVGAGQGSAPDKGSSQGGGTGGGGGVKPVALIVVSDEGVRVDSVKSGSESVAEKVVDTVGRLATSKIDGSSNAS